MDSVNPEFTITVLEARIKKLSADLEQMTKHANEGWALANTRTAQWKTVELQNDELRDSLSEILQALRNRDSEKMYTEEIEDAEKVLAKMRAVDKAENRHGYVEKPNDECPICGTPKAVGCRCSMEKSKGVCTYNCLDKDYSTGHTLCMKELPCPDHIEKRKEWP